jgi:hypothetical protein
MVGGGPFKLKPGQWTDDTAMTLCLATSLLEQRSFDARDQMDRYVAWMTIGYLSCTGECFDIGNTTVAALRRYQVYGNPCSGSPDPGTAGNGSIMRLAPVPLFFYPDHAAAIAYAGESSRTTHGAIECIDACRLFSSLIFKALAGQNKADILVGPQTQRFPLAFKPLPMVIIGISQKCRSWATAMWSTAWRRRSGLSGRRTIFRTLYCAPSTWAMMRIRPVRSVVNWPALIMARQTFRRPGWNGWLCARKSAAWLID